MAKKVIPRKAHRKQAWFIVNEYGKVLLRTAAVTRRDCIKRFVTFGDWDQYRSIGCQCVKCHVIPIP